MSYLLSKLDQKKVNKQREKNDCSDIINYSVWKYHALYRTKAWSTYAL